MPGLTMAGKPFDVVIVPFPFTDSSATKRRPALILSAENAFNDQARHCVMAMITSADNPSWPLDVTVKDLKQAGLPAPSVVRMKLFTLDNRLIVGKIGTLSGPDRVALINSLRRLIPCLGG
jgi:mRNA interferase MazF